MYVAESDALMPFLDTLKVQHGPKIELGHFFLRESMTLRERGVELFISRDVERFDRLGRDYDAARPDRFPALDVHSAGFNAQDWFTLEGWTRGGDIAFVAAARCVKLAGTLSDEMESFRFFYRNPDQQRHPEDSVEITARSPDRITGTVALQGGFWVNPAARGQGLARIFPTMCRWHCLTLWDTDHTIGFFHRNDAERGLPEVYGEPPPERWIRFRGRWNDDSYFTAASRAVLEDAVLRDYAAAEANRSTRVKEALVTKRVPSSARQGKSSRS